MPRSEDLALIAEHSQSPFGYPEPNMLRRVFDKLGWDAFTDEAVAELADHYAWNAESRDRRNAKNRALAARPSSERSDQSEQEAAAA